MDSPSQKHQAWPAETSNSLHSHDYSPISYSGSTTDFDDDSDMAYIDAMEQDAVDKILNDPAMDSMDVLECGNPWGDTCDSEMGDIEPAVPQHQAPGKSNPAASFFV